VAGILLSNSCFLRRHGLRIGIVRSCILFFIFASAAVLSGNPAGAQVQPLAPDTANPSEDALLIQARAAATAGVFANAEQITRKFLAAQDGSADGHYLLGYVLSHEGKPKDSLAEYTRAAQLRAPTANDLKMVAVDYVMIGDFVDADRWFTKALAFNPADADGWYYLGRTKYNENRFAEAVSAFESCLKLDAHNVKAENNMGLAYQGLNQPEQAKQAFETAVAWQMDSAQKDAQPYLNLGMLLSEQDHPEAGLAPLQKATALAPKNAKAHEQLARLYVKLKRWKDAQGEFDRAVELAPNSASLHYEFGIAYRDQGLKEQAQKEFARSTQLNADHTSVETPNP
jgi:tetratricopeptide (TPR) repeat protein